MKLYYVIFGGTDLVFCWLHEKKTKEKLHLNKGHYHNSG